jgi:plastocyanin
MEPDFRSRVARPIIMLVALMAAIAAIAFSVSRVLLAVPQTVATLAALGLAAYILLLAVIVGKRRSITPRALGAGLAIGLIALLGAGVVSAQAGPRELHAWDDPGDEHGEENGEAAPAPAEITEDALVWVAVDIDFSQEVNEAEAGEHVIAIINEGNLPHNVVFEGTNIRVDADGGQEAAATFTIEAGTYTYYCDIPGHRATMEGEITFN